MTLGVSLDQTQWRADSNSVALDPSGIAATGILKIGEWDYLTNITTSLAYHFRNRSYIGLPVILRDAQVPTWTGVGTGITGSGAGPMLNTSSPSSGFKGAYYNTALDAAKCSIEARMLSSGGLSLQNGGTITHDYTQANAAHSVHCRPDGQGEIRELGLLVPVGTYFKYETNDKIVIELTAAVVRYYLVKNTTNQLILLRSTRSKLTAAPKFEINLSDEASDMDKIYFTQTAEASATIEIIGVLNNLQTWKDDFFIASNADPIQLANNDFQYTYPNQKTRIRSITASRLAATKTERLAFEDFFNWHGMEKEFLFVDKARTDANNAVTEFWAKFSSPFGDKVSAACLAMNQATITESYRRDYIPKI